MFIKNLCKIWLSLFLYMMIKLLRISTRKTMWKVKHPNKKKHKTIQKKTHITDVSWFFPHKQKNTLSDGWFVAILAFVKRFNIVFYPSKSPFFTTIGGIPSWELTYPIKNHFWRWFSELAKVGFSCMLVPEKEGILFHWITTFWGFFCRNLSQWIEAKTFDSTPVVDSWGNKKRGTNVSPTGNPKGIRFDL